jgi:hypothetical protein
MRCDAPFSKLRFASAPGLAFAADFAGGLDLAVLLGLLSRAAPLVFGFAMRSAIMSSLLLDAARFRPA